MKAHERQREISLLELAAMVIRRDIIESSDSKCDENGIVDELIECRARELVKHDRKLKYTHDVEAFTCEICQDTLVVLKHSNIDKAIRFALSHIANIHIVFNGMVAVVGGKSDRNISELDDTVIYYQIDILDIENKEKNLISV